MDIDDEQSEIGQLQYELAMAHEEIKMYRALGHCLGRPEHAGTSRGTSQDPRAESRERPA